MSIKKLTKLLNKFKIKEVYFGGEGFQLVSIDELHSAQIGYSIQPDGTDLEGDWKKEWVVIGNDPILDDPYFVDTNQASLPVYTAMHGAGAWNPNKVSGSLQNFLECLRYLKSVSPVDDLRITPDESTITDEEELTKMENKLTKICGESYFWSYFFKNHKQWLEDCGVRRYHSR